MTKKKAPGNDRSVGPSRLPARRKKGTMAANKHQSEDRQWLALESRLGGREGMLAAARASKNPKALTFAELLLDPAFRKNGTKDLAKKAGLTVPEIVDIYRDLKWLETTIVLHDQLPEIIQGAAEDAKPTMVPCPECKGTKHAENGDTCWYCRGIGEIRKGGDNNKLKFIGDAVGLTGKGEPAFVLNQQINANVTAQPTSFEELVRRASVAAKPKLIETKKVEDE